MSTQSPGELVEWNNGAEVVGQWHKTIISASGAESTTDYRFVLLADSDDPRAVLRREKHERGEDSYWVVDETWTVTPNGVSHRGGESRD